MNQRTALGKLKELTPADMRAIWPHEERDLSAWIRDNVDQLNEALGLQIEIEEAERSVNGFSLDLVGTDNLTRKAAVIENQFDRSNHDHLGKLLTYSADQEAGIIVWLANDFHPAHVTALEWLNKITPHDLLLYAVKLEVFQIGDSAPAPRFQVVVRPPADKRPTPGAQEPTQRGLAYKDFWARFIESLQRNHPGISKCRSPLPQSWLSTGAGRSGFGLAAAFTAEGIFRIELYIDTGNKEENEAAFHALLDARLGIEQSLGAELVWQPLEERRACRISVQRPGTIDSSAEEQVQLISWGGEWMERMKRVFLPLIKNIEFAPAAPVQ